MEDPKGFMGLWLGSEWAKDRLGASDCDHDLGWKNGHIMSTLLCEKGKHDISYYQVTKVLTSSGSQSPSFLPMIFEVMVTLCPHGSLAVSQVLVALSTLPLL